MWLQNVPWALEEEPQTNEQHPEQKLKVHKIAKLHFLYVMDIMHIFHKPIQVQNKVSSIKPEIKDNYINQDLLDHLEESKLVLSSLPIPIIRCVGIHLP